MAGKFEITVAANGKQFYFRLKAANGEPILISEMDESKSDAENVIKSVKTNASIDAGYERKTTSNGQPYFALKRGTAKR